MVENVTSGAANWVDAVRGELGRAGYSSVPIPIEASFVGSPQRRSRVFIVAHSERSGIRKQPGWLCRQGGTSEAEPAQHGAQDGWPTQLEVVPAFHGISPRMVRALGNAVVPQCAQVIGHVLIEIERLNNARGD